MTSPSSTSEVAGVLVSPSKQAPRPLVDYVIAHELTHLLHPDHGRAFWRALGAAMPDYDARKARLRELGPALVW